MFVIPNRFQVKENTICWIQLEKLSFEQFPRNAKMASLEISDNEGIEYFRYCSVDFVNARQSESESTNSWNLESMHSSKLKVKHATCAN